MNMMQQTIACGGLFLLSTVTQADTILGVYAGVGNWNTGTDGSFSSQGDSIDVVSDLGFDDESQNFIHAALEHPIPFLPNIKLSKTDLDNQAISDLPTTIDFEGKKFNASDRVDTKLDLSHTDVVLYYEVLDNWVSLDLGLTARNFTGEARLNAAALSRVAESEIEGWIPLGYVKAQFDLPFTGFYAGGEVHALAFDDNGITDYSVRVGYESMFRVGAELGYRKMSLELEDVDNGSFRSDLSIDGVYLSLTLHI
jgi:outer membrane protein